MKFQADKDIKLANLLLEGIGCSMTKIKKKISQDDIFIDGVLSTEPNPIVPKGSLVELRKTKRIQGENIEILFEDKDLIAVSKPIGILTNHSLRKNEETLLDKVNKYLKSKPKHMDRAFVVHRLDQVVSGVIIFAKSKKVESILQENWYDFNKTYHAVVEGCPKAKSSTIESWLSEDKNYKVHSGKERPNSKHAITHYNVEKKFRHFSLLSVRLGTGRKNQIRVHLSDIGCPIVGDAKYGATARNLNRIGLHAHTMELTHPSTGKKLVLTAPTPSSFYRLG